MKTLKLGLITDIHHGPNTPSKRGYKVLELLEEFVYEMNQKQADLVIDLGDRISGINKQTDMQLQREVIAIFKQLSMPHVHLLGNHDLEHLSKEDNAKVLGASVAHQSLDIKGYHLVFWQPDPIFPEGFIATQEQLAWLRKDLKESLIPSILFTHAPFSDPILGNYYFESAPKHYASNKDTQAIRSIFAPSNVVACISGHVHRNNLTSISDVHHITLQSLTESLTTAGEASASWAWLELEDYLKLELRGKDTLELLLPLRVKRQTCLDAIAWSLRP